MQIKIFIYSLIFFLLVPNNDTTMSWRDDLKLSWNDFRGPAKDQSGAVAVTASGITFGFSVRRSDSKIIDFSAKVEAHFYPDKSWVIKELANDYILAHEQLHFDITELHVRKFRKRIRSVKISDQLNTTLNRLHLEINKELGEMQNRYDTESNNSINKIAQAKWMAFVADELRKYEPYKSKD
ncbi:hypothetical protein NA63_1618 [Flavobacteriaceae bacterium MAR_2010_105]|nr:hypothetical protein NA63_1618 [Flavobacteriaceae bacterium MAR_2010_105]